MDVVERAVWNDVEMHENGCWTWSRRAECNIIQLLAELSGNPLPMNSKLYRMPDCGLGRNCVNPEHVGTSERWIARIQAQRPRPGLS